MGIIVLRKKRSENIQFEQKSDARTRLKEKWQMRKEVFAEFSFRKIVKLIDLFLFDLEECERAEAAEVLSVQEASKRSGYSPGHISRLIGSQKIPNAGRKYKPGIRRADLPKKPSTRPLLTLADGGKGGYDFDADTCFLQKLQR